MIVASKIALLLTTIDLIYVKYLYILHIKVYIWEFQTLSLNWSTAYCYSQQNPWYIASQCFLKFGLKNVSEIRFSIYVSECKEAHFCFKTYIHNVYKFPSNWASPDYLNLFFLSWCCRWKFSFLICKEG